MQEVVKSIYTDLTEDDWFKRCFDRFCQNINYGLNHVTIHCDFCRIEIVAFLALCIFNESIKNNDDHGRQ